jgi:hypothetical protein
LLLLLYGEIVRERLDLGQTSETRGSVKEADTLTTSVAAVNFLKPLFAALKRAF